MTATLRRRPSGADLEQGAPRAASGFRLVGRLCHLRLSRAPP